MADEAEFEPFDLSVLDAGHRAGIWLSASSRLGAVNAVPRKGPRYQLAELQNDADWFRSAIRKGESVADQGARFGGQLRDLVFSADEVALLFRRTRGAASAASKPLLVRLLAAPEPVAALPWELLRAPDDPATPLVFAPDVHFVRAARDRRYPLRLAPVAPPLHVLLVLSNPQGSDADDTPFDHYEEGRKLRAALDELVERGVALVDVVDRPSVDALRRNIGGRERGYHVLHYLGHARPDALKLEGPTGSPSWVSSDNFNALLRTNPGLRLAFFAGCRTASLATPTTDGEFAGQLSIADRWVRDACQTVVGMQAVLPFRAEQVMTRLRASRSETTRVARLVRHHMFVYTSDWTDAAVRRFVRRVGADLLPDLFALRAADDAASGTTDPAQGGWGELRQRAEAAIANDPLEARHLALSGDDLVAELGIAPGPAIGALLAGLLEAVLEDPTLNSRDRLLALARSVARG